MIVLAQLFQDLEAAVVQQEPAVAQIEQRGEETTEHVSKANEELGGAVTKARAARRKKWWCFGIIGMRSGSIIYGGLLTIHSAHHYHHRRGGCRCCDGYQKLGEKASTSDRPSNGKCIWHRKPADDLRAHKSLCNGHKESFERCVARLY